MRAGVALLVLLSLAGCVLPPPDQPAHPSRMGRFVGLVARCGCSDLDRARMLDDYPKAVAHYDTTAIAAMKGYVDLALTENFDNQMEICATVCAQSCMVNAVAAPLGGRTVPGAGACLVNERDLDLPLGRFGDSWP